MDGQLRLNNILTENVILTLLLAEVPDYGY
jgi:hypothetical protein